MFQHRRVRWFAVAAAVVLAFVGVGSWLQLNNGKSGIAFADVMQRICSARTVAYVKTFEGASQPAPIHKMMHMGPGRMRCEYPDGTAMIVIDSRQGLVLQPVAKKAIRIEDGDKVAAAVQEDFYGRLLELRGKASEELGQREIDGRQTTGFRAQDAGIDYVIWADPATGTPIRIELAGEQLNKPGTKLVMRDFAFDVPLDESLFSLDPPPGYTVEQVDLPADKAVGVRMPTAGEILDAQGGDALSPREQALVYSLKECASLNGGRFPQSFDKNSVEKIVKKARKARSAPQGETADQSTAADSLAAGRIFGGVGFVQRLPVDSDWHYAGDGISLGQAEVPVCWWKPVGGESYRIVLGDLSMRTVDKAELDRLTSGNSQNNPGQ